MAQRRPRSGARSDPTRGPRARQSRHPDARLRPRQRGTTSRNPNRAPLVGVAPTSHGAARAPFALPHLGSTPTQLGGAAQRADIAAIARRLLDDDLIGAAPPESGLEGWLDKALALGLEAHGFTLNAPDTADYTAAFNRCDSQLFFTFTMDDPVVVRMAWLERALKRIERSVWAESYPSIFRALGYHTVGIGGAFTPVQAYQHIREITWQGDPTWYLSDYRENHGVASSARGNIYHPPRVRRALRGYNQRVPMPTAEELEARAHHLERAATLRRDPELGRALQTLAALHRVALEAIEDDQTLCSASEIDGQWFDGVFLDALLIVRDLDDLTLHNYDEQREYAMEAGTNPCFGCWVQAEGDNHALRTFLNVAPPQLDRQARIARLLDGRTDHTKEGS